MNLLTKIKFHNKNDIIGIAIEFWTIECYSNVAGWVTNDMQAMG